MLVYAALLPQDLAAHSRGEVPVSEQIETPQATRQEQADRILQANIAAAREFVEAVVGELDSLARQIWAFGLAEGPRRALATVAQMGAELAHGAATLYAAERWYSGAALVRQIIEVEYVLFLFAEDDTEPHRWLTASPEEARGFFSAGAMRERSRGRFRAEEYSIHCENGGHPRPRGHFHLRDHLTVLTGEPLELLNPAVQWIDLAQHVERMWGNYERAVNLHSPTNIYPERFARIADAIAKWRSTDPVPPKI